MTHNYDDDYSTESLSLPHSLTCSAFVIHGKHLGIPVREGERRKNEMRERSSSVRKISKTKKPS